jgi:hypothetical protein
MATRLSPILKVPVNFGNPADLADATLTLLGTPTIYIPENSVSFPVSFVSVILNVAFQDTSTVTGGTFTETRAACTLNGAAATTITELDDLTNTAENIGGVFGPLDFTAHFNSNYGTVTSKTCAVNAYFDVSTGTGLLTRGVYAWFEIQYTFDDSAANRIKTIGYDLESITGALTITANTAYGTILQLTGVGGILNGYATPVIRHAWAEIRGNYGANNLTPSSNLSYSFDGAGSNTLPTRIAALGSDTWQMYLIDLSGLTTNATHTLDIWNSIATRWQCLTVTIYVTYEYVVSGTTRILNYLELPLEYETPLNGTTIAERHRQERTLVIAEPGTITQRAISLNFQYQTTGSATLQARSGSQASFRAYAAIGSVTCGMFELNHLLDSRSASGSAITLARGKNTFVIDTYRSVGVVTNLSAILRVLYESDVPSQGIDTSAKCCYKIARQMDYTASADNTVSNISFAIPETNYWLIGYGLMLDMFLTASSIINVWCEVNSGEAEEDGWRALYTDPVVIDPELGYARTYIRARDNFKRHPNDLDTSRLDVETNRRFRVAHGVTTRFGWKTIMNYHAQTFTISGTISGSDGGTVNITVFDHATKEPYVATSRVGDGAYSVTVYNPVIDYIVLAVESDTKKGASKTDVPATDFDINLDSSGGGGYEEYYL